jgi:3D (Asp-Asp-Asp) domain-containing protein
MLALAVASACGHREQTDTHGPARVEISPSPTALVRMAQVDVDHAVMAEHAARTVRQQPEGKLGSFRATYYYVAAETSKERKNTSLYTPRCKRIARVSRKFARQAALQGTARLSDGRIVNVARNCSCPRSPCFFVADEKGWGVGVDGRPLSPFRSIAVDSRYIRYGSMVYVAELDGLTMPGAAPWGGFIHDGCVVADDTGGGIEGRQVDLFFGKEQAYRAFYSRHKIKRVTIYSGEGRCDHRREPVAAAGRRDSI